MKALVLVRGVPGSGKSTFCEYLSEGKYPIYAADDYHMVGGEYKFDPSKLHMAHKNCQERTEDSMAALVPVIFVNNTFVKGKDLKPYYELAEKYGYKVFSIVVENRMNTKNIHSVPEEKLIEMERNLRNNLKFR